MKIAVLSDIHGNIAALDAVLADIETRSVDKIVNLGDILSGGLFPERTADRLMAMELPTIRGNHERQLLEMPYACMSLSDRHAADCLRADQFAWIASLPATLRLSDDVLLVHGTPESDLQYFLDTVTEEGLRLATKEEVKERTGNADFAVILCGHTHLARVVYLTDGRMVLNPGSVGLPAYDDDNPHPHVVEVGSPHARYAIVTKREGSWSASFHAVEYDWEQAACDAEVNGRLDWARAFRTGRA
ncbi:metallophosphoesterase [Altericroceibacterium spongiae]|uniref:Metallophosphoesterase n=1 Tax=Altericroceibacterium spongiae TaxID=2320269 RepID=A0A420EIS0_9SPHN|nr:metallophosphoesterase family protein [Altericroceibacterium spongiae]RKF20622.1 metallophosphoesterase [Altericroceibacterium spongiae]